MCKDCGILLPRATFVGKTEDLCYFAGFPRDFLGGSARGLVTCSGAVDAQKPSTLSSCLRHPLRSCAKNFRPALLLRFLCALRSPTCPEQRHKESVAWHFHRATCTEKLATIQLAQSSLAQTNFSRTTCAEQAEQLAQSNLRRALGPSTRRAICAEHLRKGTCAEQLARSFARAKSRERVELRLALQCPGWTPDHAQNEKRDLTSYAALAAFVLLVRSQR